MKHETYHIGQKLPYDAPRGIIGAELSAYRWHALRVAPGKEAAMCEVLKIERVFAFCPMEERTRVRHGRKVVQKFPTVTQIIYARFRHEPQWDVMKDRRLITGVFSHGDRPIRLHPEIIRALQGLPTRAEELAAARAEMRRLRPGDKAEVVAGPLAGTGLAVEVLRSEGGRVWWRSLVGGIRGDCAVDALVKRVGE